MEPGPRRGRAARGLARLQPAAPLRRAGRRARRRVCPGDGAGRDAVRRRGHALPDGRRRLRRGAHPGPDLRDLPGPPRRRGRRARRRDPARPRLHREGRDVCEHRGPRAVRLVRRRAAG